MDAFPEGWDKRYCLQFVEAEGFEVTCAYKTIINKTRICLELDQSLYFISGANFIRVL